MRHASNQVTFKTRLPYENLDAMKYGMTLSDAKEWNF